MLIVVCLLASAFAGAPGRVVAARPGSLAANASCVADTEPNDTEDQVEPLTAPSCIDGTLPASDQDLFLWTIDDSQRGQRWTISLEGVRRHRHGPEDPGHLIGPGRHADRGRQPAARDRQWTGVGAR